MIGDEVTVTLLSVNGLKSAWDSTPPKASAGCTMLAKNVARSRPSSFN
jgi:hypothetical protein